MAAAQSKPWYAGEHQDALFYLLIAIFFLELAVGGIAFFYGIIHARPETPGGPPVAQFPWLVWALAATLAPVALLLIVHLAGSWVSNALTRDAKNSSESGPNPDSEELPENLRRFYASVRHAPTIVLLMAILLAGAALFFVDGALATVGRFFHALIPYIPWLVGSIGGLLAICFLVHALLVYRQRKMEQEYAWRREVLEKTGLVVVDKSSIALPQNEAQKSLPYAAVSSNSAIDITPKSLPNGNSEKK